MNPGLDLLQPYPFERLNALTTGITSADVTRISLTIGEPQHAAPAIVLDTLREQLEAVQRYPNTRGLPNFASALPSGLHAALALRNSTQSATCYPLTVPERPYSRLHKP